MDDFSHTVFVAQQEAILKKFFRECVGRYYPELQPVLDQGLLSLEFLPGSQLETYAQLTGGAIQIDESLLRFPTLCKVPILHELIHYKTGTTHVDHRSEKFQNEVKNLFNLGVYTDVL